MTDKARTFAAVSPGFGYLSRLFPPGDGLAQGFRAYFPRLFERFCRPRGSFALISPEVIGVSPLLPLAEICVLNPFAPISPGKRTIKTWQKSTFALISPDLDASGSHVAVSVNNLVDKFAGWIKPPDRFNDLRGPVCGGVGKVFIVRLHLGQNAALIHFRQGFADRINVIAKP